MATSLWIGIALGCSARPADAPRPSLQVTGESYKPRRGEPLPAVSPLLAEDQVRLRGVRGEILGVQVHVPGDAEVAIRLVIESPAHARGAVAVQAFAADWVEVRAPSTAMYGGSRGAGWYPDRLVPQPGGSDATSRGEVTTRELAFFDVAIAKTAAPGPYRGQLAVGARVLPVTLVVEPHTIDVTADPLVWVWYKPAEVARAHDVVADSAEHLAWEGRYAALIRAHGAYLSSSLTPDNFALRRSFLEGARYWPVQLDTSSREALAASVAHWLGVFRELPAIPFSIPVDEPRDPAAQAHVRDLADGARAAGAGPGRLLFAVTAPPNPALGDNIDVYLSWLSIPRSAAAGEAALWTYNGAPGYAGSMIIDTHGSALRTWGWIAARYDVPLWYAWEGLYFSDRYNDGRVNDPLRDPVTFRDREDAGNGDGLLVYPGALPSLRLKALRRGLQDRQLLSLLSRCGDTGARAAAALAQRMIPAALGEGRRGVARWPDDEAAWETARGELLDALNSHPCP